MPKCYYDTMDANHPVMDMAALFVVDEQTHRHSQMRKLMLGYRIESPITERAGKGKFSNGRAQRSRSQCADAPTQFKVHTLLLVLLLRILFIAGCRSRRTTATSARGRITTPARQPRSSAAWRWCRSSSFIPRYKYRAFRTYWYGPEEVCRCPRVGAAASDFRHRGRHKMSQDGFITIDAHFQRCLNWTWLLWNQVLLLLPMERCLYSTARGRVIRRVFLSAAGEE